MKKIYTQEVANYLNNKFGDDFTLAEPYPYWMEDRDKPYWKKMDYEEEYYEQEIAKELNKPMTEREFKCWCDAMDEQLMENCYDIEDEQRNIVGYYYE